MQHQDFEGFRQLLADVHAFYRQDMSEFALDVWWQAMRAFDLAAVRQAMGRHTMNPDTGQFMPKPADVVKMLAGRTVDAAQVAWSKVDRAIRHVGTYRSVAFDDALIHRVIQEMGGWVPLGTKTEDEWPFVAREFETRYRGYAMRGETSPEHPPVLVGICEADNSRLGHRVQPPSLIGDRAAALRVIETGSEGGPIRIGMATAEDVAMLGLKSLRMGSSEKEAA